MKLFSKRASAMLVIAALLLATMSTALAAITITTSDSLTITSRDGTIVFDVGNTTGGETLDYELNGAAAASLDVVISDGGGGKIATVSLTALEKANPAAITGTATLAITSTATDTSAPATITLNIPAVGALGMDGTESSSHTFATISRNTDGSYVTAPTEHTFTVKNTGGEALTDVKIASITDSSNAFTVTPAVGQPATSLAAGSTTTIKVVPKAGLLVGGPYEFTINLTGTTSTGSSATLALTGSVTVQASGLSNAKSITKFTVGGRDATINETAGTITLVVPASPGLAALTPTIVTTSTNATPVSPASGVVTDFSNSAATPVEYTVTAEDGTQKVYKVTITTGSSACDITGFTVPNIVGSAVINSTTAPYTVTAVVKYGTGLTSLAPTIAISQYAVGVSPASLAAQNFTNPVPYTVTAQDGSTKVYTVTITAQDANNAKSLDSFSINGYTGSIVGTTVTVDMPYGTNVNSLIPTYSYTGKAISLTSGQAMSFVNPVTVRVTANDNTYIDYTVTVNVMAASSEKQITNFTIPNMVGNAVINHTARTITVTMPAGTSVTALTPTITTTFGATVTPASLVAQNFTSPVTYTVRATDGSTTTYTVTVVLEGNITLTHTGTGVRASGNINSNATLNVTENSLHASGTCTACGHIRDWMAQGSVLKVYNVEISSGYTGNVTITMPVSTSYSGRQLTVVHCNNGTLERTNATVDTSGNISASFSSVSPFAVLNGLYSGLPGDGADPPKTGDDMTYFSWGALLVTMALLLAAVFGMYLINRRRKQLG